MFQRLSARLTRRDAIAGAISFAGAWSGAGAYGALSMQEASQPRISVLGTGNRLSILVTDGPARLLIVAGNNTADFSNAWAAALPLLLRRVDVLYVSPKPEDAPVVTKALREISFRRLRKLAPEEAGQGDASVAEPGYWTEQVRLSRHVHVTVATSTLTPANGSPPRPVWSAEITRSATRIVALSEPNAATLLQDLSASALVLQDGDPLEAFALVDVAALVSSPLSKAQRRRLTSQLKAPLWHVPVFSGEVVRLTFVPDGLRLPRTAHNISPLNPEQEASPQPGPSAISW